MRMLLPTIALMGSLAGPLVAGVDGMTAQTPQRMAAVQSPPAQTPPPAAPTPPPAKPAATRPRTQKPKPAAADAGAAARSLVLTVQVTDIRGMGQGEVKITTSGPVIREGATDAGGIARLAGMRPGDYRIRLERDGLITLERDLTLAAGKSIAVDVTMSTAPAPPPPPPAPAPTATAAAGPPGEAKTLSLSDFIEKNLIGREPTKQTTLGCSGNLQAVLLQIREPQPEQTDDHLDITLYVVAGQGSLKLGGRDTGLSPASFAVIPRGTPYSLSRKGGTPLIVLLNRANEACGGGAK